MMGYGVMGQMYVLLVSASMVRPFIAMTAFCAQRTPVTRFLIPVTTWLTMHCVKTIYGAMERKHAIIKAVVCPAMNSA